MDLVAHDAAEREPAVLHGVELGFRHGVAGLNGLAGLRAVDHYKRHRGLRFMYNARDSQSTTALAGSTLEDTL